MVASPRSSGRGHRKNCENTRAMSRMVGGRIPTANSGVSKGIKTTPALAVFLNDHRAAETAGGAGGGQRIADLRFALHLIKGIQNNPGPGGRQRMPQRDGAAVGVQFSVLPFAFPMMIIFFPPHLEDGKAGRRKSFMQFDEIQLIEADSGSLQ